MDSNTINDQQISNIIQKYGLIKPDSNHKKVELENEENLDICSNKNKVKIILLPLVGIELDSGKKVHLGQDKNEVVSVLGNPNNDSNNTLHYDNLELRVSYDKNSKVEFIEVVGGTYCTKVEPFIYGMNAFELEDTELVELLTKKSNGRIDDSEAEYGYCFLEISVGIWRGCTKQDSEREIMITKEDGTFKGIKKEELIQELEHNRHFESIGIGVKGYYVNK